MDNNGQQSAVLHDSLMTFFLVFHGILGHCMVLHGAYLMVFHCIQGNCMGSEKGFKDHV